MTGDGAGRLPPMWLAAAALSLVDRLLTFCWFLPTMLELVDRVAERITPT